MFRQYILLFGLLIPIAGISQGLVNNGANIVISNGSNVYINGTTGHYTSQNSGLIKNSSTGGTVTVMGNWVNNSTNTGFTNDGATVVLGSSSAQSISGTNGTGFYKLTASGGGTKTVNTASTISNLLTLGSSTYFNSNGNTTLLATATTNANVATIPSTSSVIGNMKVQIYFTGGGLSYRGTRAFSAPIDETDLIINKTYAQLKNYVIITGVNGGGFDLGGAAAPYVTSLTRYYEPGTAANSYTNINDINDPLPVGFGALFYYRGDRSGYTTETASTDSRLNAPFSNPASTVVEWNGPINQGDIQVNLSYTNNTNETAVNGYNLLGNPYPAYINWDLVTKNNVKNVLRFIKPGGGFATYDGTTGGGVSLNAPNGGDLRYIAPGEAFYTKALGSGATVTFKETSKAVTSTVERLLYNPKNEKILFNGGISSVTSPRISSSFKALRMNLQDAINKDETLAVFEEGESTAATDRDIVFMGGSTVSLSTLASDNTKLTINHMPTLDKVSEVKLYVTSSATGPVKLNFTDLSAVENYNVYLKDAYLNKVVDVKTQQAYEFTIDKSVATSFGDNRLSLIISPPTTLPVAIASFKADKVVSGAKVSWNVKSEVNIAQYEVERSTDGVSFSKIKEVTEVGKTAYAIVDENPALSQNYYRLKLVDADGRFDYSSVVSVDYSLNTEVNAAVFPNPASDIVKVKLPEAKAVKVLIFDVAGKKLKERSFSKTTLVQENITELQEGVYIIHVLDSNLNTEILKSKFIVKK